jgi:4-aminobutyrate aminotransferase
MIGIEFIKDRQTREYHEKLRDQIVDEAFQRGLLLLGCGRSAIRITPPLCVSRSEVDEALQIFEECITLSERESVLVAA